MFRPRPGVLRLAAVCLALLAVGLLNPAAPSGASSNIVISQVYGGGGNSGATYTHDFIELFNRGNAPVSLDGWSIQYASATGTGNFGASATQITELPNVTLQPGQYYLVQQASNAAVGSPLPTPDLADATPISMAAGAGKVALVSTATTLGCNGFSTPCSAAQLANVIDLVGYGSANFFEGSGTAPTLSATLAAFRQSAGCTDTDENGADFSSATPAPRTTAAALNICDGPPPPDTVNLSLNDVTAAEGNSGTTPFTFTVSLSAPAPAGGVTFDIATADATGTTADADYQGVSLSGQTIAAGATQATFTVQVNGDTTIEGNETFLVHVTNVTGADVTDSQGVGTITNDDIAIPNTGDIVISQVYGGGGNSGATLTHDFVELFNQGTTTVSLAGWSVQYASSGGSSWAGANLSGTIAPGGYYLVRLASSNPAVGGAMPAADATGVMNMAAGAGKVALVVGTTQLTGTCPLASTQDFVGFGATATCSEGGAPTATLSATTAAFRRTGGCTDTDHNGNDFTVATPAPRNGASATNLCGGPSAMTINDVTVAEGDAGTTTALFTVTLASPAPAGGVTFDIATADDTATAGSDYVAAALTAQTIAAGQQSYTLPVTVIGDTDAEPAERFFVNVTNVSGANLIDGQGLGTITNDDFSFAAVPIHAIQGAGLTTPYTGTGVMTTGIVTARKGTGFFVQMPDSLVDSDPETSEAVFVFTSTAPGVLVGDLVTVRGTATEFFNLTQIDATTPGGGVTTTAGGMTLPAPIVLTTTMLNPAGPVTQLERLEAMRVHADSLVSVAPTNQFGEIYTVLSGVPRPMREPGIEVVEPIPPAAEGGVDCCIPVWDLNPERIVVGTGTLAGSTRIEITSQVTLTGVTGPLDFSFGDYMVLPEMLPAVSPNISAVPVPAPAANEFTVAGYNIENFTGNATQRTKASLTIRHVLRYPDVIGVIEIGSLSALQGLATQINSDASSAGDPNPLYEARLIPFTGTQHVGFLVKTSRVQINSVTQRLTSDTYVDPVSGNPLTLHDRPPLVLDATVSTPGLLPGRIVVVVNHLRSFIDIELLEGDGRRVRAKRTAQAEAIAGLLQELQSDNPAVPVIAVGDYNAYEFSDGYTDPISILKGQPTPGDQIVVAGSPDLVNPDFVNLTDTMAADQRYSFIFEGTPQALDHVLVNTVAHAFLQRYAIARVNADFPDTPAAGYVNNASRPEANSDHDAPVAYFAFPGTPVITLVGGDMTVEAYTSFTDPGATAQDSAGALPVSVTGSVDVNVPGTYTLTYTASNNYATTVVTRTVIVKDTVAPDIDGFSVTPTVFGPPNHKMFDVSAFYSATDAGGQAACVLSVTSNEAVNGVGDGNTAADWEVVSATRVRLRAERAGNGSGRVYTITVTCTDASGNASARTATVSIAR